MKLEDIRLEQIFILIFKILLLINMSPHVITNLSAPDRIVTYPTLSACNRAVSQNINYLKSQNIRHSIFDTIYIYGNENKEDIPDPKQNFIYINNKEPQNDKIINPAKSITESVFAIIFDKTNPNFNIDITDLKKIIPNFTQSKIVKFIPPPLPRSSPHTPGQSTPLRSFQEVGALVMNNQIKNNTMANVVGSAVEKERKKQIEDLKNKFIGIIKDDFILLDNNLSIFDNINEQTGELTISTLESLESLDKRMIVGLFLNKNMSVTKPNDEVIVKKIIEDIMKKYKNAKEALDIAGSYPIPVNTCKSGFIPEIIINKLCENPTGRKFVLDRSGWWGNRDCSREAKNKQDKCKSIKLKK